MKATSKRSIALFERLKRHLDSETEILKKLIKSLKAEREGK